MVLPLRSGPAAAAVMDETTNSEKALDCESAPWEVIRATAVAAVAIGDAVPGGRAALQAVRCGNLKHKRNGLYHLTVAKFYAEHIKAQLALDGVALASQALVDATHEVDIDKGLFPAGVVEQIHLQLKTVATVRKAWESEDRFTYQVQ